MDKSAVRETKKNTDQQTGRHATVTWCWGGDIVHLNSLRLLVGLSTYFMVASTSLLIELVLPIIKYAVAPLEVGSEFALNWEVGWMRDLWKYLLIDFETLN